MALNGVKPTVEQLAAIAKMRAEREELAAKLKALDERLAGAKHFFGVEEVGKTTDTDEDSDSMVSLIVEVANNAQRPMSYKDLRKKLAERGIAQERLTTNYFYAALTRLAKKEKITVKDRKVGKAPA